MENLVKMAQKASITPVSVIIPVFNGSKTLAQSLDAVFRSHYEKFEVIVVDDKSTDNSVEIAKKFPCIIIRKKTNTGAADSRNIGAKAAKYNILFFTDSDCVIKRDTIKKIVGTFSKEVGIVAGTYSDKFYPKNNIFSSYQQLFCYYNYSNSSEALFGTQCCAIRKKIFFELGGFDKRSPVEDVRLQYQIGNSKYKWHVNMDAQVFHLSRDSLSTLLKGYFKRSKDLTMLALEFKRVLHKKGYAFNYATIASFVSVSVAISGLILASFYQLFIWVFFAGVALFLFFRRTFYKLFDKSHLVKIVPLSFICDLTIIIGSTAGALIHLVKSMHR